MANKSKITLGADPELLVLDPKTQKPIPAWMVTSGVKQFHENIGGAIGTNVHADGVALEFNFNSCDISDFGDTVQRARVQVGAWLNARNFSYRLASYSDFDKEYLMHPLALNSGCDPDFDAYDENHRPRMNVIDLASLNQRFFGGHIHIGYDKELIPDWALVRAIDACWYLAHIQYDRQGDRRRYYGKAGIYRSKPYGVEYRTPSPFWLSDPKFSYAFSANVGALLEHLALDNPKVVNNWFHQMPWKDVKEAIDKEDLESCHKLYDQTRRQLRNAGIANYAPTDY